MSYGRSPKSIMRVRPLLDTLVESDSSIEWTFDDPKKIAYYIWEAIRYAIRSGKKEFEKYTNIPNKFKFKVIEPDIVKAELRSIQPNGIIIRDVNSVMGVIGAVIKLKQDKLIFPDISLSFIQKTEEEYDMELLETWCEKNSYKFYVDEHNRLSIERI